MAAKKTGDLTIRLDRRTRARIDRLAERRLGRKRSTGTFIKMLALSALERDEKAAELRAMLRQLPPDPVGAEEIAARRRQAS
jgi:predicted transcriptional regulator